MTTAPAAIPVMFVTMDGRLERGRLLRPLSLAEKLWLFEPGAIDRPWYWMRTEHGRTWIDATRVMVLPPDEP